jgi:hypothetical protein
VGRYETPPIEVDRQVANDLRKTQPPLELIALLDKIDKAHPSEIPAAIEGRQNEHPSHPGPLLHGTTSPNLAGS